MPVTLSAISVAILGFLLGIRHAVDPDHVVAVGTIATRHATFRHAATVGALWGLGHTVTIMAVGGSIIVLRIAISPRVGLAMEFAVAMMLIALGLMNVANSRHADSAPPSAARPLAVGMVHGLAGSAAVALLVLATVTDSFWAFAYLCLFGLGTIVGMILVTAVIAMPASFAVSRVANARRWLTLASGVVSLVFGAILASELTGAGLFSDAPTWTPH
jgi:high-affinity nickel-transport protein